MDRQVRLRNPGTARQHGRPEAQASGSAVRPMAWPAGTQAARAARVGAREADRTAKVSSAISFRGAAGSAPRPQVGTVKRTARRAVPPGDGEAGPGWETGRSAAPVCRAAGRPWSSAPNPGAGSGPWLRDRASRSRRRRQGQTPSREEPQEILGRRLLLVGRITAL